MISRTKKLVLVVILTLFAVVSVPAFEQGSSTYYVQRDLPRKQPEKAKEKEKEKPKREDDRGGGRDRGDSKKKDDKRKPMFY